jgi:hypothetical protein
MLHRQGLQVKLLDLQPAWYLGAAVERGGDACRQLPVLDLGGEIPAAALEQLLGLQILSLAAAAGKVANLGALLPVLRLLANPTEGLKAVGPLATPLRALPEQHLLLSVGEGLVLVVALSTTLLVITIRSQQPLGGADFIKSGRAGVCGGAPEVISLANAEQDKQRARLYFH